MVTVSHLPLGGGESDFDELGERKPPKHLKSQVRGSVISCQLNRSPHQENLKFRPLTLA